MDATEAHHIKPRRQNGSGHPHNLLSICTECHDIIDAPQHLTKDQVQRLSDYPKIQSLLMVRLMADLYDRRAMAHVEQEVLKQAIRVLEHPDDAIHLPKLKSAIYELRTRYKRSH